MQGDLISIKIGLDIHFNWMLFIVNVLNANDFIYIVYQFFLHQKEKKNIKNQNDFVEQTIFTIYLKFANEISPLDRWECNLELEAV